MKGGGVVKGGKKRGGGARYLNVQNPPDGAVLNEKGAETSGGQREKPLREKKVQFLNSREE